MPLPKERNASYGKIGTAARRLSLVENVLKEKDLKRRKELGRVVREKIIEKNNRAYEKMRVKIERARIVQVDAVRKAVGRAMVELIMGSESREANQLLKDVFSMDGRFSHFMMKDEVYQLDMLRSILRDNRIMPILERAIKEEGKNALEAINEVMHFMNTAKESTPVWESIVGVSSFGNPGRRLIRALGENFLRMEEESHSARGEFLKQVRYRKNL